MTTLLTTLLTANALWAERFRDADPNFFGQCATGQSPKVLWIGCADSRVPGSVVTDATSGDILHRNIAKLSRTRTLIVADHVFTSNLFPFVC